MFNLSRKKKKQKIDPTEQAKIERLTKAESELEVLKARQCKAVAALNDRHSRNHWRESVQQIIQGA